MWITFEFFDVLVLWIFETIFTYFHFWFRCHDLSQWTIHQTFAWIEIKKSVRLEIFTGRLFSSFFLQIRIICLVGNNSMSSINIVSNVTNLDTLSFSCMRDFSSFVLRDSDSSKMTAIAQIVLSTWHIARIFSAQKWNNIKCHAWIFSAHAGSCLGMQISARIEVLCLCFMYWALRTFSLTSSLRFLFDVARGNTELRSVFRRFSRSSCKHRSFLAL